MPPLRSTLLRSLSLAAWVTAVSSAAEQPAAPAPPPRAPDPAAVEFFEKSVRPILVDRCFKCHATEEPKGGLRLDSRAAVLAGGDSGPVVNLDAPEEGLLVEAIRYKPDGIVQMPPTGKLADPEIAALVRWVQLGVPWPDVASERVGERASGQQEERLSRSLASSLAPGTSHWAFQPPHDPALPGVRDTQWPKSPLDHFILSKLEEAGFSPAPPADKRTLIRRATYSLIGLPPTPQEIEEFLNDDAPDAFAKVVDRLLASPHYGERWGRHWLDVARYADSNGVDENVAYANAFRYRDYVVAAFNHDKPYDQFVREQLAGDLLPAPNDATSRYQPVVATGFLSLGAKMLACDDPVKMQMDIIDEQIDTIGRTFLGLTLGCARCHDHKFDPLTMPDYYALAGIFKSTKTMENYKVVARWFERPLATQAEVDRGRELSEKIDQAKAEMERLTQSANDELVREARRHVAEYLLAGTELLEQKPLINHGENPVGQAVPDDGTKKTGEPRQAQPDLPLPLSPSKTSEQVAGEYGINPAILDQWVGYLKKTKADPTSVLQLWHRFNASVATIESREVTDSSTSLLPAIAEMVKEFVFESRRRLAERYQQLFDRADHAWLQLQLDGKDAPAEKLPDPAEEALRQVLYDSRGPFALPDKAETYYPPATLATLDRLRGEIGSLQEALPEVPYAMGVAEDQPQDVAVHIRGSHLNLGEVVPRRFPAVFETSAAVPIDSRQSGRLELAEWITRPDHPLTSRVMVNRIWRWHFGTGLVRTPDNFGTMGQPPVNQPLLDWLAMRFVENGWSIDAVHRLILLSATYQMSSAFNEGAAQVDPENTLYWRMPPRRLEAEAIRDAILAVSGTLDTTMGGSILKTGNHEYVTNTGNRNYDGYDSNQRSLYLPVVRSALYEMFEVFDFAEPSALSGDRATTTVAPQSLFMMNSDVVTENARHMAAGLLAEEHLDDAGRVRQVYQRALARPATQPEVDRAVEFVSRFEQALAHREVKAPEGRLRAWQSFCRAIFASSEFIYVN